MTNFFFFEIRILLLIKFCQNRISVVENNSGVFEAYIYDWECILFVVNNPFQEFDFTRSMCCKICCMYFETYGICFHITVIPLSCRLLTLVISKLLDFILCIR